MKLVNHPSAKHITAEVEALSDGTVDTALVVYTDLSLDALSPDYDKSKLDELIEVANEHMTQNKHVLGKMRIRTMGP